MSIFRENGLEGDEAINGRCDSLNRYDVNSDFRFNALTIQRGEASRHIQIQRMAATISATQLRPIGMV